jgi:phosphomannomutase
MGIMRDVVLFDMDGTLTAPRKKISKEMFYALSKLSQYAKVGIVTGSGYDYVKEQCDDLIDVNLCGMYPVDINVCNGTKRYTTTLGISLPVHRPIYDVSIKDEIGQLTFKKIVKACLELQAEHVGMLINYENTHIVTGKFISYRGSMINWSPCGREADDQARDSFVNYDNRNNVRDKLIEKLQTKLKAECIYNVTCAKGGSTSIDIYPTGWDKTYVLKHYPESSHIWFIGDKCQEGGNDKALYDALLPTGRSYETKDVDNTLVIIEEIIKKIAGE